MPLVFAENEVTVAGIDYEDLTGVSYQYPARYRHMVQPGEPFVYYRGRRTKHGARVPQVYFGSGVVGETARDLHNPDRYKCQILDYLSFSIDLPFKDMSGNFTSRLEQIVVATFNRECDEYLKMTSDGYWPRRMNSSVKATLTTSPTTRLASRLDTLQPSSIERSTLSPYVSHLRKRGGAFRTAQ